MEGSTRTVTHNGRVYWVIPDDEERFDTVMLRHGIEAAVDAFGIEIGEVSQ